jgi:hypothetical protein
MMGERLGCQDRLFYEFDLDEVVPRDHLLRRIDAVLDLKWNLGLTRLRLRGLSGARDEFHLAATVQNLRRLATLAAIPPPNPAVA